MNFRVTNLERLWVSLVKANIRSIIKLSVEKVLFTFKGYKTDHGKGKYTVSQATKRFAEVWVFDTAQSLCLGLVQVSEIPAVHSVEKMSNPWLR